MANTVMAPSRVPQRRRAHITFPTALVVDTIHNTQGRAWGSDISEMTGLNNSTVYQILHRLEHRGLLASEPEPDGEPRDPSRQPGPPRRFYQLTPRGERELLRPVAAKLLRTRMPAR